MLSKIIVYTILENIALHVKFSIFLNGEIYVFFKVIFACNKIFYKILLRIQIYKSLKSTYLIYKKKKEKVKFYIFVIEIIYNALLHF